MGAHSQLWQLVGGGAWDGCDTWRLHSPLSAPHAHIYVNTGGGHTHFRPQGCCPMCVSAWEHFRALSARLENRKQGLRVRQINLYFCHLCVRSVAHLLYIYLSVMFFSHCMRRIPECIWLPFRSRFHEYDWLCAAEMLSGEDVNFIPFSALKSWKWKFVNKQPSILIPTVFGKMTMGTKFSVSGRKKRDNITSVCYRFAGKILSDKWSFVIKIAYYYSN